MSAAAIARLVATLTVADPATCDRGALAELAAGAQRVRSWLDAFEVSLAAAAVRLDEGSIVTADGRRSSREAAAVVARGELCAAMPVLHEALAERVVAAGHADVIARVAGQVGDDARSELLGRAGELVAVASRSSVDVFERHVRDLGRRLEDEGLVQRERMRRQRSLRRWTDRHSGMCHTHLAVGPETDARISAVLDAAVAAERTRPEADGSRSFDQLQADAFVALVTGARGGGRRPAEVMVLVDHETLADGLHHQSVCETADGQPVPPETVRRLACDADLLPVVLDGAGVVLDHGRSRRVATAEQRRALRAMYRTCAHPYCTVRFADCEIHHVIEWLRQRGPTDLANLLPLCSRHHHDVHEGGWQLTLHPGRAITLHRPDSTTAFAGSTVDVAPTGVHDDHSIAELTRRRLAILLKARPAA